MRNEQDKYKEERQILSKFARASGLLLDAMRKGDPDVGEPDVCCESAGEVIYFELSEACVPEFAEAMAHALKRESCVAATWGSDGIEDILRKKLAKTYKVEEPIELVLYTNGRNALPDDVLVAKAEFVVVNGLGPFRKIWLYTDEAYLVGATSSS